MSYTSAALTGGGTAYYDGSFTTPVEVYPSPRVEYPFPGDQSTKVIRRRYHVTKAAYSPMELDTPDSVYTTAYLVSDIPIGELGGGVWEIERTFAQIPDFQVEYESYVFPFPGVNDGSFNTVSELFALTGAAYCTTNGVLSWSEPTVPTGVLCYGSSAMTYTFGRLKRPTVGNWRQTFKGVVTAANSLAIGKHSLIGTNMGSWNYTVVSASAITQADLLRLNRPPQQRVVVSRVEDVYFLAGDSPAAAVSSPDQVDPLQRFEIYDGFKNGGQDGYVRNKGELQISNVAGVTPGQDLYTFLQTGYQLSARVLQREFVEGDPGTVPSRDEYVRMVYDGVDLVAEGSQVQRYMGNIYRNRTRFVKAQ